MTKAQGTMWLLLVAVLAQGCGGPASEACSSACDGVCVAGRCLTTLASNVSSPRALAVGGTSAYFTYAGIPTGSPPGIMTVPVTGGGAAPITAQVSEPSALAVDGTSVYWTDRAFSLGVPGGAGAVRALRITGMTPAATLASDLNTPLGIAVDATSVYWTESPPGRVAKVPLAGGTPTVLASGLDFPGDIAVDATHVYWVEGGTDGKPPPEGDTKLMMVPLAGGTPTTLATAGVLASSSSLAVDAHDVYWTISVYSEVNGASVCTLGKVLSVPIGGGAATTLASGQNGPGAIAVDATAVYWLNQGSKDDGAVMKLSKSGGAAVTLAAGRTVPMGIAVDGTSVYWREQGPGGVMKTAKD